MKKFSLKWALIRIVSFLQLLATAFFCITSFISLFQTDHIYFLFQTLAFLLICSLAILFLNVFNNNYPDKPIVGKQKSFFNWLFLLNFLLLAFLFALIFAEYRDLKLIANVLNRTILLLPFPFFDLPRSLFWITDISISNSLRAVFDTQRNLRELYGPEV